MFKLKSPMKSLVFFHSRENCITRPLVIFRSPKKSILRSGLLVNIQVPIVVYGLQEFQSIHFIHLVNIATS